MDLTRGWMVSGIEAELVVCQSGSKDQMFGLQLRSRCGLQLLYRESGKMLLGMGSFTWGVNPGSVRPLWGMRKTEGCKSSNALSVQSPLELVWNQVYLAVTKKVQWR